MIFLLKIVLWEELCASSAVHKDFTAENAKKAQRELVSPTLSLCLSGFVANFTTKAEGHKCAMEGGHELHE